MSAAITLQAEIVQRSHDSTQHNIAKWEDDQYSLSTTYATYATDTNAFATTVYTAYNADKAIDDTVEIRYFVNVNSQAEDSGVINVPLNAAGDLQTAFNNVIANAANRVPGIS